MSDLSTPLGGHLESAETVEVSTQRVREIGAEVQRFLLQYEFGLREVETKVAIFRDEFRHLHDYNPIEHVVSRVKSPESISEKLVRRGLPATLESARENLTDIAGVRITCSFQADAYRIFELLTSQDDIRVHRVSDYMAEPKPNGYKSLHAIIGVPVFLSTGPVEVLVEVQIRTIAMDFWASLEHKIHYKYEGDVPADLVAELKSAADTAAELDGRMERLHKAVHG